MQKASHLNQTQRDKILELFCDDMTATYTAKKSGASRNTVNNWYKIFRGLIWQHLQNKPRFQGVVEMDQAFFGRKRRRNKRHRRIKRGLNYGLMGSGYRLGREKVEKKDDLIQVFGISKRQTNGKKKSIVYLHVVRNAKRSTIIPIVHLIVEGGSTLYTDNHRTFDLIGLDGYKHGVVDKANRTVFWAKDKKAKITKDMHTGNIETFWKYAKGRLDKFWGISRYTLPLHIKECEFRWNNPDLMKAMKKLIA